METEVDKEYSKHRHDVVTISWGVDAGDALAVALEAKHVQRLAHGGLRDTLLLRRHLAVLLQLQHYLHRCHEGSLGVVFRHTVV